MGQIRTTVRLWNRRMLDCEAFSNDSVQPGLPKTKGLLVLGPSASDVGDVLDTGQCVNELVENGAARADRNENGRVQDGHPVKP